MFEGKWQSPQVLAVLLSVPPGFFPFEPWPLKIGSWKYISCQVTLEDVKVCGAAPWCLEALEDHNAAEEHSRKSLPVCVLLAPGLSKH